MLYYANKNEIANNMETLFIHCAKIVLIRSFFWSAFSRIRTKYGDLRRKSPYSVQMRENTDQQKTPYLDTFYAVIVQVLTNLLEMSQVKSALSRKSTVRLTKFCLKIITTL